MTYRTAPKLRRDRLSDDLRAKLRQLAERDAQPFELGCLDAARLADPLDHGDRELIARAVARQGAQ